MKGGIGKERYKVKGNEIVVGDIVEVNEVGDVSDKNQKRIIEGERKEEGKGLRNKMEEIMKGNGVVK